MYPGCVQGVPTGCTSGVQGVPRGVQGVPGVYRVYPGYILSFSLIGSFLVGGFVGTQSVLRLELPRSSSLQPSFTPSPVRLRDPLGSLFCPNG